jgi:hypothetical protein
VIARSWIPPYPRATELAATRRHDTFVSMEAAKAAIETRVIRGEKYRQRQTTRLTV